jgi:hypothetical protein
MEKKYVRRSTWAGVGGKMMRMKQTPGGGQGLAAPEGAITVAVVMLCLKA